MSATVRLVEPLSEGGMGAVWLADHLTLQMRVVVKVMAAELAETGFARFSDEALAAAQVRSPHVVQMLDRGVTRDGVPFIVMEHLQGETLFETVLLHGPRPLGQVVLVVDQLAKALDRVHGMGIVHRDVKPDNVFVCDVGQAETFVKLFDFGIAKSLDGWMTHLTGAGVVMGTPCYLSPEAIDATHEVDARLDLWGLAAVAFYALTGHEAFVGEDPRDVRASLHAACRPLPSRHVPSIPKGIDAWFERAFAVARDSRFSTATEMAEALSAAHAETLAAKGGAGLGPSPTDWVGELPASARAGSIVADKYVVERVIGQRRSSAQARPTTPPASNIVLKPTSIRITPSRAPSQQSTCRTANPEGARLQRGVPGVRRTRVPIGADWRASVRVCLVCAAPRRWHGGG